MLPDDGPNRPPGHTILEPAPEQRHVIGRSERRRSVAFVDAQDESWACFLATFPSDDGRWHGYFAFRPSRTDLEEGEVRTTEIFKEDSEAEVHAKARGLGRPLLAALLESALHTSARKGHAAPKLRGRFRDLLTANAYDIAGDWDAVNDEIETDRLRSLYTSYRLDQVSHFICLVEPEHFEGAVDEILGGSSIDFRAKDRLQYAMMVVDHIEGLLPLPDFDTWVEDFRANPEAYRLYTHTLHREGRLP